MRILTDTNILIDIVLKLELFFAYVSAVLNACIDEIVEGAIAAHSVTNLMYILRKNFSLQECHQIILGFCRIVEIESVNKNKLFSALNDENFSDFEDCLQCECAETFKADYIVTRNLKDFKNSRVPAISPNEFLKIIFENKDIHLT